MEPTADFRYPVQWIDRWTLEPGQNVTVRPVLPQDAALQHDFFTHQMGKHSRYQRFMISMRELPCSTVQYFTRIDALNFTLEHDDGQMLHDVEDADVVLVGISRTSKTPTSIYLANRGIKTANVPIVLGMPVQPEVVSARGPLVVGLVASAERISHVRQNRILGSSGDYRSQDYVDRAVIAEELTYARQLCSRHGWPLIDVTRRSIEETAAAILALRGKSR